PMRWVKIWDRMAAVLAGTAGPRAGQVAMPVPWMELKVPTRVSEALSLGARGFHADRRTRYVSRHHSRAVSHKSAAARWAREADRARRCHQRRRNLAVEIHCGVLIEKNAPGVPPTLTIILLPWLP